VGCGGGRFESGVGEWVAIGGVDSCARRWGKGEVGSWVGGELMEGKRGGGGVGGRGEGVSEVAGECKHGGWKVGVVKGRGGEGGGG